MMDTSDTNTHIAALEADAIAARKSAADNLERALKAEAALADAQAHTEAAIAAAVEMASELVVHDKEVHPEDNRVWINERPYVCEESTYRRIRAFTPKAVLAAMKGGEK